MFYVLAILWHERQRFLPGVLAVAFSALLIALQCGLLLGLFSVTSIPVDRSAADIWIGAPHVLGWTWAGRFQSGSFPASPASRRWSRRSITCKDSITGPSRAEARSCA